MQPNTHEREKGVSAFSFRKPRANLFLTCPSLEHVDGLGKSGWATR
jgi:hypothetical protein